MVVGWFGGWRERGRTWVEVLRIWVFEGAFAPLGSVELEMSGYGDREEASSEYEDSGESQHDGCLFVAVRMLSSMKEKERFALKWVESLVVKQGWANELL